MSKPKILVQLDTDDQVSVFDSVVAIDSGVDHLLRQSSITPDNARDRVHGAIFTRGFDELRNTAIFIGGSDVARGEQVLSAVVKSFVGPLRCSVMIDSGGANTTAAAAVLAAAKHLDLSKTSALVLAATGPVGQRVAWLLARAGAAVRVASRSRDRAAAVAEAVASKTAKAKVIAVSTATAEELAAALDGVALVVAAGAASVELLPADIMSKAKTLRVAIDLNAVPPPGIGAINVTDKGIEQGGVVCYGAIGVGGTKMKIHKAAIKALYEANDRTLDAPEIFEIGRMM